MRFSRLPAHKTLEISDRKAGAIKLTPVDALPETRNLRKLKHACVATPAATGPSA